MWIVLLYGMGNREQEEEIREIRETRLIVAGFIESKSKWDGSSHDSMPA